jgi:hypothetical protein
MEFISSLFPTIMSRLLRKLLFRSKLTFLGSLAILSCNGQVINHVANGSFESVLDYNSPFIDYKAIGWSGVDSTQFTAFLYNKDYGNVPNTSVGIQYPKHGKGFIRLTFYCPPCGNTFSRSNIKNRLKSPLRANRTYCAKMYVNFQDINTHAIDGFGIYFGKTEVDTIIQNARLPLTFLNPQISNSSGNILSDTALWIPIAGTFVATGGEKFLVIANFKSDAATNTAPTANRGHLLPFSVNIS